MQPKKNFNENSHILRIYTRTWPRDSHGLYDYESTQTRNTKILIANVAKIVRVKNDIKQVSSNYVLQTDEKELLSFNKSNSNLNFKIR